MMYVYLVQIEIRRDERIQVSVGLLCQKLSIGFFAAHVIFR